MIRMPLFIFHKCGAMLRVSPVSHTVQYVYITLLYAPASFHTYCVYIQSAHITQHNKSTRAYRNNFL